MRARSGPNERARGVTGRSLPGVAPARSGPSEVAQ